MKLARYRSFFTERRFWDKLRGFSRALGTKSVYAALLLYYAYHRKETPAWAKRVVLGALGYLIVPVDLVPDLTPIVGYTDDIGVLSFGLVTIAAYVNQDVRTRARAKLGEWFAQVEEEDLAEVEERL